jgi:hypothetical protein
MTRIHCSFQGPHQCHAATLFSGEISAMSKARIVEELPKLGRDERQEIFDRLCALQEAEFSGVHQQWVNQAMNSGPALPASPSNWDK